MKLIDFIDFEPFNELRKKMGAELAESLKTNGLKEESDTGSLFERGKEVDREDVKKLLSVLPDGTITFVEDGERVRVLVYIRDISDFANYPKFHISWCQTLERMLSNNRYQKYVASQNLEGEFEIRITSSGGEPEIRPNQKLKVCKNCLENISWSGFRITMSEFKKEEIVNQFSIPEFFEKYPKNLIDNAPQFSDRNAPTNTYSQDFKRTSLKLREECGWKCKKCNVILDNELCEIDDEKINLNNYLHVHHIDGIKSNNAKDNLTVLCLKCHAAEYNHGHLKNQNYYKFLEIYKKLTNNQTL